jgi:hypothetical protein
MGYWMIDGKQMTDEEHERNEQQEAEARESVRLEIAARTKQLREDYEALNRLLEEHPEIERQSTDKETRDRESYKKLRRSLGLADQAPRCRWVKQDGRCCGSPQMRQHIYCYAHIQMMEARALMLKLPALEDANAIQIALMRVQTALVDHTISERAAGLLLYSLQIATINVEKTTFGHAQDAELATNLVDEREALSEAAVGDQGSGVRRNQGKDLPRMNMDDTDKKSLPENEDEYGREGTEGTILPHELISGAPPAKGPQPYELHNGLHP